jgi:hypothetical protein
MAGVVPGSVPGTVAPAPRGTQRRAARHNWRPRRDPDLHPHLWGTWGPPGWARGEPDTAGHLPLPLLPIDDCATDAGAIQVPPVATSDLGTGDPDPGTRPARAVFPALGAEANLVSSALRRGLR